MDRPLHRRAPRRPLRVALVAFKGAALGGLLTLVVVGGLHLSSPSALPGATEEDDGFQSDVQRAAADHHCSFTGYADRSVPASALIRTVHGAIRQVTFEVGWDVYNHRRPGTLLAVCLDQPDADGLVKVSSRN